MPVPEKFFHGRGQTLPGPGNKSRFSRQNWKYLRAETAETLTAPPGKGKIEGQRSIWHHFAACCFGRAAFDRDGQTVCGTRLKAPWQPGKTSRGTDDRTARKPNEAAFHRRAGLPAGKGTRVGRAPLGPLYSEKAGNSRAAPERKEAPPGLSPIFAYPAGPGCAVRKKEQEEFAWQKRKTAEMPDGSRTRS